jgi:hypothetical protein
MSAAYTDDEVEAVVEQIIRSAIRRPYGALGQRDVGTTFADFQEQTIAVLTLTPNAPFYVVFLGTERLSVNIDDVASTLVDLDDMVAALAREATPVASTTALANAQVAADALAVASSSRTKAFVDIQSTPAFQRLDRNIQSFLDSYSTPNLTRGSTMVRTSAEAFAAIPGMIQQLIATRQTLIDKVTSLSNAITDYEALNLPGLLSTGVLQRASQVLADSTTAMAALTPSTRVEQVRQVTLNLLAARAIIRNFASLATPTIFAVLSGSGSVFSDANHPATSARLVSDFAGPYSVRADDVVVRNQLNVVIDGTLTTVVTTGGSFIAELTGTVFEPYSIISSGTDQNNQLELSTTEAGVTTSLVVPLTAGNRLALQIVADITAAITTEPLQAEPAILPLKFQGKVDIAGTDPGALTFTLTNPFSSWVNIGVKDGDKLRVLEGANDGLLYQVNGGGVTTGVLTCTRLTGAGTTNETNKNVEVGGPSLAVRVRISDGHADASLDARTIFGIGDPDDPVKARAAITLGFSPGMNTSSQPLTTQFVVDAINSATSTAVNELSKLVASVELQPVLFAIDLTNLSMRSEPSTPSELIVFKQRIRGNITVGGTTATLVVTGLDPSVIIGDEVVIRSTTVIADTFVRGSITGITGTTVSVTFASAVSVSTNVLFEFCPNLNGLPFDTTVVIDAGPNKGNYDVDSQDAVIRSQLTLKRVLGSFSDTSGQPVFFTGSIEQGHLVLASKDTSLVSAVVVNDGTPTNPSSAASLFWASRPATAIASTPWFALPAATKEVEVGDMFELYISNTTAPALSSPIVSIDGQYLELSPELPATLGSFALDVGAALPIVRIRKTRRDTFDTFSADAKAWLARPELQPMWLTELDRRVTIALNEKSPSSTGSLRQYLLNLYGILVNAGADLIRISEASTIESISQAYTAPVVSEIDTLIESLQARGGDRAIDLLLDAHFQDYFGLDVNTISYAGTVISTTNDVVRNDLPLRSTRRSELVSKQISMGQSDDPDYEYDQSDIDNSLVPDSPGPNPPPKTGDAY